MPTIETGDFRGPMTITHDREIHGALRGPVTVEGSACVVVKGSLTGPLTIGPDAIVTVFGSFFDTDELTNDGLLLIAGTTDHVFGSTSGRIAVAAGSLILDRDVPETVHADGTCHEVSAVEGQEITVSINTEASDYVTYDGDAGRFFPLPAA